MNDFFYLINYGIGIAALMISLFGLIISLVVDYTNKGYKKYFFLIFGLLIAYSVSNLAVWIVSERPGYVLASYIGLFCESFFSSLLMPTLTLFLLFCAKMDWRKSVLFYIVAILWLIYFVLLIITQFTDWIYYYTPDNIYYRGPFYAVLLAPPVLLMAANLYALYNLRASLSSRYKKAFLIYILIPLVCMLIQMKFYGVLMTVFGSTVSAFIMLIIILLDLYDKSIKQARENADLRANNLVLQMRPHFIYNTMMSIYYLCEKDTKKAQQVILDFTSYLRKNFTAVVKDSPIPFTEEMEHTRAYLAVEQARFEDQLFVEFDTEYTAFRLPPLTLQPIVENAVKHGLDPELSPLKITVQTREADSGAELTVIDTGPGFSENDSDEPHIALSNIRERLAMMCGGTLTVSERKEGGVTVAVFIPQSTEKV